MGATPIHEVSEGRNKRIKLYWKLWFGNNSSLPSIGLRDTLIGPKVTVELSQVEKFCTIVGNDVEAFRSVRSKDIMAPKGVPIVTGWKVCIAIMFLFLNY